MRLTLPLTNTTVTAVNTMAVLDCFVVANDCSLPNSASLRAACFCRKSNRV